MMIIRITQANSITHTEFRLLEDYVVIPQENFELAVAWAEKGLLDEFTKSFLMLIENQQNYYAALRRLAAHETA